MDTHDRREERHCRINAVFRAGRYDVNSAKTRWKKRPGGGNSQIAMKTKIILLISLLNSLQAFAGEIKLVGSFSTADKAFAISIKNIGHDPVVIVDLVGAITRSKLYNNGVLVAVKWNTPTDISGEQDWCYIRGMKGLELPSALTQLRKVFASGQVMKESAKGDKLILDLSVKTLEEGSSGTIIKPPQTIRIVCTPEKFR